MKKVILQQGQVHYMLSLTCKRSAAMPYWLEANALTLLLH